MQIFISYLAFNLISTGKTVQKNLHTVVKTV